jgi:biotin carboxylase
VAVGAGRWQLSGIRAAKEEGLLVLAIDGSSEAPGFGMADRFAVADIRDPRAVLDALLASGIRPSGAIAFVTDAGMAAAAALREAFDLPGPRADLVRRLTDKCHQRRAWSASNIAGPNWFCVMTEPEAAAAIDELGQTDIIIKPSDSAGSRGVSVVERGEDWRPAFAAASAASRSGNVIIETFIRGVEYTVETFSHRGKANVLAVTEKRKVAGTRGTVAVELASPSIPAEAVAAIGKLAIDALAALGHTDGAGHTEILRKADGSLWLVEAAGRGGGFMVAEGLVPRASGFALDRACALQAVGLEPPPVPEGPKRAFVLRFLPTRPGIVAGMSGFDRARDIGNVVCEPLVAVGDRVGRAVTDAARLAYILSWADDRAEAISLADRAEACLRIDVVEAPPR